MHVIDKLRSPHSLDVADFDKDGKLEIVCAEHDPFKEYRSRSRMFLYKKADAKATRGIAGSSTVASSTIAVP